MEIEIKQLLKDMQRNVDYAFKRGTELEREKIIKMIEERIKELRRDRTYALKDAKDDSWVRLIEDLIAELENIITKLRGDKE